MLKPNICLVYQHVYEKEPPESFGNGSQLSLFDYTRCKLVMHGIVECLNCAQSRNNKQKHPQDFLFQYQTIYF